MRDHRASQGPLPAVAFATCLLIPLQLLACSTPVFQYALARWSPDSYGVKVVPGKDLTQDEEAGVELLTRYAAGGETPVNLDVTIVGATNGPSSMTVFYPWAARIPSPAWRAPLNKENAEKLVRSPARERISESILDGQCAVWVLLQSGDRTKDDDAGKALQSMLRNMEKTLKLPEDPTAYVGRQPPAGEARSVSFSIVRVSRTDPAEAFFVQSLLRSEPDLLEFDGPMAFPVFGQGRLLHAIVGKGINQSVVEASCEFLVGACSCEAKALNPGIDLLMSANWASFSTDTAYAGIELPPLTGVAPEADTAQAAETATVDSTSVQYS